MVEQKSQEKVNSSRLMSKIVSFKKKNKKETKNKNDVCDHNLQDSPTSSIIFKSLNHLQSNSNSILWNVQFKYLNLFSIFFI